MAYKTYISNREKRRQADEKAKFNRKKRTFNSTKSGGELSASKYVPSRTNTIRNTQPINTARNTQPVNTIRNTQPVNTTGSTQPVNVVRNLHSPTPASPTTFSSKYHQNKLYGSVGKTVEETVAETINLAKQVYDQADQDLKDGKVTAEYAAQQKINAHKSAEEARAFLKISGGVDGSENLEADPSTTYSFTDGKTEVITANTDDFDDKDTGKYKVNKKDKTEKEIVEEKIVPKITLPKVTPKKVTLPLLPGYTAPTSTPTNTSTSWQGGYTAPKYTGTPGNTAPPSAPDTSEADRLKKEADELARKNERKGISDRIAQEKKNAAISKFKAAFDITSGRLGQEKAGLTPRFRDERALIGVQGTMNKTAQAKNRALGGLSASGSLGQDTIAQNVITGGRMSESQSRESDQRADIERRLSEAVSLREQGMATAASEAEITSLTYQLREMEAEQARYYKQSDLADTRNYQEGITANERSYQEKLAATKREQYLTDIANQREDYLADRTDQRTYNDYLTNNERLYQEYLTADQRTYADTLSATQREQYLADMATRRDQEVEDMTTQREWQLEDIDSQRLYNLSLSEINSANETELLQLKQSMDIEMTNLDAQIKQAEANQDFALQTQLYNQKYKLESNNDALNNAARMAEIEAKKVEETAPEEERYSLSELDSTIRKYIGKKEDIEGAVLERLARMIKNGDATEEQSNKILFYYSLEESDLLPYIGQTGE